jgi:hypothetical protein
MTDMPQEAERSAGEGRKVGGQPGNTNSKRSNRLWADTIRRVLAQGADPDRIRRLAEALVSKAEEGDMSALKELGDRLDGKAAQQVFVNGDEEGGPVKIERIKRIIVDPRGPTD